MQTKYDLINTDSFHQLRPSLEAAVAEFARIPDDDDGGIETTLLKLEGKWKPRNTLAADNEAHRDSESGNDDSHNRDGMQPSSPVDEGNQEAKKNDIPELLERKEDPGTQIQVQSVVESEDSQWSVPLLERGLGDESMRLSKRRSYHPSGFAVQQNLSDSPSHEGRSQRDSSHPSIQVISKTESLRGIPSKEGTEPAGSGSEVIVSHRDARSNLSSEMSLDKVERDEVFESDSDEDPADANLDLPPHALVHPPSPPMTIPKTSSVGPSAIPPVTPVHKKDDALTPGPSPTRQRDHDNMRKPSEMRGAVDKSPPQDQSPSSHVPFVLAYDSRLLTQQLTLVEKSALDEVDWRDLVEMRWSNQSSSARNWVQFLAEKERRGVDLVIGRFNLMVKWVLSEIVLTTDIHERARTISKFIHVAAHARRMCNYATLLQIVIALTSVDCTRLRKTWALVSSADKRLLERMEPLIKPVRNFHDLRVEMETANIQDGCIPFVGE